MTRHMMRGALALLLLPAACLCWNVGQVDQSQIGLPYPESVGWLPYGTPPAGFAPGSVLPQPREWTNSSATLALPRSFRFELIGGASCDDMMAGFRRAYDVIFGGAVVGDGGEAAEVKSQGALKVLYVNMTSECDSGLPPADMDESYLLEIHQDIGMVSSAGVWGALRGLVTFTQLIQRGEDGGVFVNKTVIKDWPRFPVRSFMIDTSRHYLNLNTILKHLDAMEAAKMNVLHWHIVDDHSFPFQSKVYPNLSNKGAFNQYTHVYSREDVAEVVEYARLRGIRVVPEFDSPGHVLSWGKGYPELLSKCLSRDDYGEHIIVANGPLDPTRNYTYQFMENLLGEINEVFPDSSLFLGGDEVPFGCWKSNPLYQDFMTKHGIADYAGLESFYIQRLLGTVAELKRKRTPIVWQEVFDNGVNLDDSVVVDVWKNSPRPWQSEMQQVTSAGHRAILSAPWYLNYISYGEDWRKYYTADPTDFPGTVEQKKQVLGGEACMWGEYVDSTNFLPRTWPRAAAVAERLWSDASVNDPDSAEPRLNEFRCRLVSRGVPAEPIAPGFCANEWPRP